MLTIKLIPAEYGDCLLISAEKEKFNLLIDGGTSKTYQKYLKTEIKYIKNLKQRINLMICTHMDNDHIGGLVQVLKEENAEPIENIWYNGFIQVINSRFYSQKDNKFTDRDDKILDSIITRGTRSDGEQEVGINDGMALGVLIEERKIPLNKEVEGEAISTEYIENSIEIMQDTMIIVLGPSKENILTVEDYWKNEMVSRNYTFRVSNNIKLMEAFEYQLEAINLFYTNERILVSESDELEKYIGNLEEIDESITNRSSITFILEHKKKKYLFLGDAVIDDTLLDNIEKAVGHEYRFSAIKLPHHGSRYNISQEFIRRYKADEYFCLTNSKRFGHPDIEVLATIICNDLKHKSLIFNYPIDKAYFFNREEWKEKYNYEVIIGNGENIIERIFE